MKKNLYAVVFAFTTVCIAIACKHNPEMPVPADSTNNNGGGTGNGNGGSSNSGGDNVDTGICFERDILPIFISNCAKAGCHDAASRQDGFQFTDYNSIISKEFVAGNANATELYEKITEDKPDKIMPPPPSTPLSSEQKDLIRRWINEGAQNSTNCSSGCDSNDFKFSTAVQPILDKSCKGCHSGSAAPKGILLDSYSGTVAAANSGRLLGAIKHLSGYTAMPQGGNKLSDCEILQIEKWINAGTPND